MLVFFALSLPDFWSYEYNKHGTCAYPELGSEEEYFNATIVLNNYYEPNDVLEAAGISPSDVNKMPVSELESIFEDAWGVTPVISCSAGE